MMLAASAISDAVAPSGAAWQWHAHPDVHAATLGLLTLYFFSLRRFGPSLVGHPDVPVATTRQKASFAAGVGVLWLVSASPLHDIGENYLFAAHMTQHMVQAFVVAPLLLLGIPRWMFQALTRRIRPLVRLLGQPLMAGAVFNGLLVLIHWPAMVDLMLTNHAAHFFLHYAWITAALIMWLPVHSPAEDVVPRLNRPTAMGYLFLMTFLPTVPASFLTFGETLVYPRYGTFPRLWGVDALQDQLISGLIMKTGVGFLLWGIITAMFFRWANREEQRNAPLRQLAANDLQLVTAGGPASPSSAEADDRDRPDAVRHDPTRHDRPEPEAP